MAARIQEIQKVIFTRIHVFLPSELDLIVISRGKSDSPPREMRPKLALRPEKVEGGGGYTGIWPCGGITGAIDHGGGGGGGGGDTDDGLELRKVWKDVMQLLHCWLLFHLQGADLISVFSKSLILFFFPLGFYSIVLYLPGVLFVHGGGEGGKGGG